MNQIHWRRLIVAGAAAIMALSFGAAAQAQSDDELVSRARQAVNARDATGALQALDEADKLRGKAGGYTPLFLRGAALQDQAKAAGEPERMQLLSQAREAYTRALEAAGPSQPKGPAYNNLALIAAAQGTDAAARRWFEQAIGQNDERVGLYAINYARFLESRDPEAAIQVVLAALKTSPDNVPLRTTLTRLYARSPSDERLAPYLARSVNEGYTLAGMSAALDELIAAPTRPTSQREQLMIVVAAALARETSVRPKGLDASTAKDVSSRLEALSPDARVGVGARQLRRVLVEPPAGMSSLSWWSKSSPTVGTPAMSPVSAIRELVVALGLQHGARDRSRAEGWLRAGIAAGERGPDPDAFLRLVELYVNTDQSARIKPLMDEYQWDLFGEKSNAYRRGDWPSIYRLHLALGMTYAEMKVWKSDTPFQNAVFQLSNASNAADQINKMASAPGQAKQPVALPASAALKLSEGYAAVGKPELAAKVKLDTAVKLKEAQRVTESHDLIKQLFPHEVEKFNASDLNRYKGLKAGTIG